MVRFLLTATPTAIPTGPAVVTSTIEVAGAAAYLTDLDLITNLTHTFPGDLDITLQSPAGTVATITTDTAPGTTTSSPAPPSTTRPTPASRRSHSKRSVRQLSLGVDAWLSSVAGVSRSAT